MLHYSLTEEQSGVLHQDAVALMQSLDHIATLLNACYGNGDLRVVRAEESKAALQRLLWAIKGLGVALDLGKSASSGEMPRVVECTRTDAVADTGCDLILKSATAS